MHAAPAEAGLGGGSGALSIRGARISDEANVGPNMAKPPKILRALVIWFYRPSQRFISGAGRICAYLINLTFSDLV